VQRQKQLWDSCLQVRMWMQPALEVARRIPPRETHMVLRSAVRSAPEGKKKAKRSSSEMEQLKVCRDPLLAPAATGANANGGSYSYEP
jgi:hypothetical protein